MQTISDQSVEQAAPPLLDLPPIARLQIVQASQVVDADWLDRSMLEPTLSQNVDGLWVLSVHRQGDYGKFEVPYIDSLVLLADSELGLVVVLVGYHGSATEKYGRMGYMTQKGQFFRFYQLAPGGDWQQVQWRLLCDEIRQLILETVQEHGPTSAKKPGKLQAERKPPTKRVAMISFKVVRVIDERYFSLYQPDVEYIIGQRMKEPAKPRHGGGFYSYPSMEKGTALLTDWTKCLPFHRRVETRALALLECEIGGRIIDYAEWQSCLELRSL